MPPGPKIFRDLYHRLEALLPLQTPALLQCTGRLQAPGKPVVHYRCERRSDGSVAVVLLRLDPTARDGRPGPDPLIQFKAYPGMAVAEITRLVHHADYVLDPLARSGRPRRLVMRIAGAYTRRWLRQLVTDGYVSGYPGNDASRELQRPGAGSNAADERAGAALRALAVVPRGGRRAPA